VEHEILGKQFVGHSLVELVDDLVEVATGDELL
jgi:hypothetical protein